MLAPVHVTFDRSSDGMGVGSRTPRISWRFHDGAPPQHAYEIELDRASSTESTGKVPSTQQLLRPWPGAPLRSRERVGVRVRAWAACGDPSPWSQLTWIEAALLDADDWIASPVGAAWEEPPAGDRRPIQVRREFTLASPVASARLYATAHGVFEAEINGQRVDDTALDPGWTVYGKRLRYRTYDVTAHLAEGRNVIGAWLGDGWYRGRLGFQGGTWNIYGSDQAWIAQLEVRHQDGSITTIATDDTWSAGYGPIMTASLYDGEHFDARSADRSWSKSGSSFEAASWSPVRLYTRDRKTLIPASSPPVRCTQELRPVTVTERPGGRYILDFGQNLVGRLAITVTGPRGTRITLRHAEVLIDGELATRPLREARATDTYVLAGNGPESWEPRFTIHGFRYAEIAGWPGALPSDAVVARVYHTDMKRLGSFTCSDPQIQQLHDNVVWSMRGNFVDIPTDCPARDERLGWTGDVQVFAPTAAFLYDCSSLLDSWLTDVGIEQLPDGTVPWYVPVIPGGPMWTPIRPGAAWGDVVTLTPWVLYEHTGDPDVLRAHFETGRAWVNLIESLAGPSRLWDTGFQLGDWLDPSAPAHDPAAGLTDPHLIATAYFAWSAHHLARMAHVLGRDGDSRRYEKLAEEVRAAFQQKYVQSDGRVLPESATAYVLAISFGLLQDETSRRHAGERLASLVRDSGYRIPTGFVGTPLICEALTATGQLETAYRLLKQTDCPSWLYPVTQGATTIWERWDSLRPDGTLNPDGMTSFNHFALGSVANWLHRVVAGIAPAAPGYRHILFAPRPGGGLTSAAASHETPYGRAAISWSLTDAELTVDMHVPPGSAATVHLPGLEPYEVGAGAHTVVHQIVDHGRTSPSGVPAA